MTKIRKEKAELSSAAKNKKLSTPPPRPQLSFPRMRGSIHPHVPEAAFGNTLTATDNDESETSSNNEARKTSHGARYTMGPRVREDDGNKKRKSRAKFSGKEQKTQHTAATPSTVIPVHTGINSSIHARSRVWKRTHRNRQRQSETNHNTDNEVPKPSHGARYTMGPLVREDDRVRELIRTTSNTNNKALKPSNSACYTMGPRVREDGGVRESMVNLLSLTHATAYAKDGFRANKDSNINIEASLDDCLISPFLITPSIVPLNTIFY
ncbi:TPA: hypothetical protein ACGUPU_003426 [Vibrio vulnificus]